MGGFFGAVSNEDVIADVYYGTDYHSHLGTRRGGIAAFDAQAGLQREIHNIENSPFRTKFANIEREMKGKSAIGIISDYDPQPIMLRSNLGTYAMVMIGKIQNTQELIDEYLDTTHGYFDAMSGSKINATEITAALINQKSTFEEGIKFAQDKIKGTTSILILKDDGTIIAARDKVGRLPVIVGQRDDGYSVSFEDYAQQKLGYEVIKELGPGEIIEMTVDGITQLAAPGEEMKICSFLWSYYRYPTSSYEGVNVEMMRYRNGEIMAKFDAETGTASDIDYVGGVPDSGTPHAIGYANAYVICNYGRGVQTKFSVLGAVLTFVSIFIGDMISRFGLGFFGAFNLWPTLLMMYLRSMLATNINSILGLLFRIGGIYIGYTYSRVV